MEWKLSPEQNAYQQALREWLSGIAPPQTVRRWLEEADASAFESRFAGDGWAGVGLPEVLGGQGGGLAELALTAEELARAAAPSAAWLATVLAVPALAGQAALAAAALAGETAAYLIPAEVVPDQAAPLTADAAGTLTGVVPRVLAGDTAAWFVVPAGDGSARELRLVDASDPGVTRTRRRLLDRSRSAADVTLDGVPSARLTADASVTLAEASARAAVLVAADSLGAAERMLDLAVDYSKQRRQFGVPIGSFQAVKHAAAAIEVGIEAGRSAVHFAAASVDAGDPQSRLHAAVVKAQVTAEGARAAESALTMHGAIGYTWAYDLQLFFKRARLDRELCGTPAVWNERIADGLALV
ncbi:MAG TPA: acyl-CoA dehydrogenase family protein [Trebonia sp.]|nr:acyl-CoA dehydrogenase family protein [Trebonia sp.]